MSEDLPLAQHWKENVLAHMAQVKGELDIRDEKTSTNMLRWACAANGLDFTCAMRYFASLLASPSYRWMRGEIAAMEWLEKKHDQPFMRTPMDMTGDLMSFDAEILAEVTTQRSSIVSSTTCHGPKQRHMDSTSPFCSGWTLIHSKLKK